MPNHRKIDPEVVRALWPDRAITLRQIADRFGCDPGTVSQVARRLGLPSRYKMTRSDPDALTGGEWVRDPNRGVMVWRKTGA